MPGTAEPAGSLVAQLPELDGHALTRAGCEQAGCILAIAMRMRGGPMT